MSHEDNFDESIRRSFEHARKNVDHLHDQFHKLLCEPTSTVPKAGDRVVVAIGFLGMGHVWVREWVREEAEVKECGDTSYLVQFKDYRSIYNETVCKWVHQALITDVLPKKDNQ